MSFSNQERISQEGKEQHVHFQAKMYFFNTDFVKRCSAYLEKMFLQTYFSINNAFYFIFKYSHIFHKFYLTLRQGEYLDFKIGFQNVLYFITFDFITLINKE